MINMRIMRLNKTKPMTYGIIFCFKGSSTRLCSALFSSTKSMA